MNLPRFDRLQEERPVVVMTRGHSGSRVLMRVLELLGYSMGSLPDKPSGDLVFPPLKWTILELARRSVARPAAAEPPAWEVAALEVACGRYCRWLGAPTRWGWKLPETYLVAPHVAAALPGARFVELVRDGRDLAFKWHRTDRPDQLLGRRLLSEIGALDQPHHIQAARSWAFQVERFGEASRALAGRAFTLRFEDLCARPLAEVQSLCAFLEVEMPDEVRRYVEEEIDTRAVGSHRREPPDRVAEVERTVGETLSRCGYEARGSAASPRVAGGDSPEGSGVFLTGATGRFGRAVLRRLLAKPGGPVHLLIRPRAGASAQERFERLAASLAAGAPGRLHLAAGDLGRADLGLGEATRERLLGEVSHIVHLAERSGGAASAEELEATHVGGARGLLELAGELAGAGRLRRLDVRSTAYVAGTRPGVVTEEDLERGQDFANDYERSKYEAERLVRDHMDRLPIAIYRPSTLIDSRTWKLLPMVLLSRNLPGLLRPGRDAWLDLLPLERAADALLAAMESDRSLGGCFHLVAGPRGDIHVRELLRRMPAPPDHLTSYVVFDRLAGTGLTRFFPSRNVEARLRAERFGDYLRARAVRFDDSRTRRRLGIRTCESAFQ